MNIAIIGLGKQNTKDHILAAKNNKNVTIVAVCDVDASQAKKWSKDLNVPSFTSTEKLLSQVKFDVAMVAVPHKFYLPIIQLLLNNGIHVLKEKPLAFDLGEAKAISRLAKDKKVNLTVAVQRKHNKIYKTYSEFNSKIGNIFSIHGEYTLNIPKLDEGWRKSKALSGGGAVIDMGYHLVDLIVWYFGVPDRISSDLGYKNRQDQDYDVEDTAKVQFSYNNGNQRILGSMLLSRIYPSKEESLSIYGSKGTIKIFKDKIELFDNQRELVESTYVRSKGEDVRTQFDDFIQEILDKKTNGNHEEHLANMVFIDAVYRSDEKSITVSPFNETDYVPYIKRLKENRKEQNDKKK